MVRVPGPSSGSGFHRESRSEKVKIKAETGIEAPAKGELLHTRDNEGSPGRQSLRRDFDDKKIKEEDQSHDLEKKYFLS